MTNWTIIESHAYELATEDLDTSEITSALIAEYGIQEEDAEDIALNAVELYVAGLDDEDYWDEMGYDPYEGCCTWDC